MKTRVANQVRVNFRKFTERICMHISRRWKYETYHFAATIGKFENTDVYTLARAKSDIQIHPSATKFNCFVL